MRVARFPLHLRTNSCAALRLPLFPAKAFATQVADLHVREAFMQSAAMSARAGVRLKHGGPFGASIVRDGEIIACAHNTVLHSNNPCCHAEMNAIMQASRALRTHDLSDCILYTTCEPCPMCWGAVQRSRLMNMLIGVDRHTAKEYGFDDKVFYDKMDFIARDFLNMKPLCPEDNELKAMLTVHGGISHAKCLELFTDPAINKTHKRRFGTSAGSHVKDALGQVFGRLGQGEVIPSAHNLPDVATHERFMAHAIEVALQGARTGLNKEQEPFGCLIVKNDKVIAEACNTVLKDGDARATAEVNAIGLATKHLADYNLEGCDIYTTAHPDPMSMGAILWSRISNAYYGVSPQTAADFGFEESFMHWLHFVDEKREVGTIETVAKKDCEEVFQEWKSLNGQIY